MQENPFNCDHFVLKMWGKYHLVFKTKHDDQIYLEKIAEELLGSQRTHFVQYEIYKSNSANDEMTSPEYLPRS